MVTVVGDDFHVIDVSNPSSVVEVGGTNLTTSGSAIAVRGSYAYVTTEGSSNNFQVVDVIDPTNPVVINSFSLPARGNSIVLEGNVAYVSTSVGAEEFHAVDITDPLNLSVLDSVNLPDTANEIVIAGSYAYVELHHGDDIHVIDISNPSAMVEVNSIAMEIGIRGLFVADGTTRFGV